MNFIGLYRLGDDLSNLRSKASALKSGIFARIVMSASEKRHEDHCKKFLVFLNDFLRKYDDQSDELWSEMKSCDVPTTEKIKTLEYSIVRKYVYANYDYPSALKFLDGIKSGMSENEFEKPADIENFMASMLREAFKNNAESVGELIELSLSELREKDEEVDATARAMFKNIRHYEKLFVDTDRSTIYNTIEAVLEELVKIVLPSSGSIDDNKMVISTINNVIEYIVFTIAAYIIRVVAIEEYFSPFYYLANASKNGITEDRTIYPIDESTDGEESEEQAKENCPFESLRMFDHAQLRDIRQINKFFEVFKEFAMWAGVSKSSEFKTSTYGPLREKNIFYSEDLKALPLITVLEDRMQNCLDMSLIYDSPQITELHNILKCSLTPKKQAISGNVTDKAALLHSVRGAGVKEKRKTVIYDLFMFSNYIVRKIDLALGRINREYERLDYGQTTITNQKMLAECNKMLLELYNDFIFAVYRRLLVLSKEVDAENCKEKDDIAKMLTIDTDSLLNDAMMSSVPDTMRMPLYQQDQFVLPVFESLQMYDDMLRSIPEFADDPYLTEAAGDLSKIMNLIWSFIVGCFNQANAFFKNFEPARAWVEKNQSVLEGLTFSAETTIEDVIPYKIAVAKIKEATKGLQALKQFDADKAMQMGSDKFKTGLYGDMYDAFTTKGSADTAVKTQKSGKGKGMVVESEAQKILKNKILFGEAKSEDISGAPVSGDKITEQMKTDWIPVVLASTVIKKIFAEVEGDLKNAAKAVKSKIANNVKKESVETFTEENDGQTDQSKPGQSGESEVSKQPTTADGSTDKNNKPAAGTASAKQGQEQSQEKQGPDYIQLLQAIQKAQTNIWTPIQTGMIKALQDNYRYIKIAHGKAQKADIGSGEKKAEGDGT